MTKHWYILERDGTPQQEASLPERPDDSNPAEGEAFRPWYKADQHLHIENGKINGIHGFGTLDEIQSKLKTYLEKEQLILEKFGGAEDQLLPDVDAFLSEAD